jgi:hypothetical protein
VRADGRRLIAAAVRSRPLGAGPLPHLTVLRRGGWARVIT